MMLGRASRYAAQAARSVGAIGVAAVALAMLSSATAQAQYSQTIGEYSGQYSAGAAPPATVGTFTDLPNTTITGATVTGFFGNSAFPNTADLRLFVNSIQVAQCSAGTSGACGFAQTPTPFSFTFSMPDLAALTGPTATLTVVKDGVGTLRLGETTLTIDYGAPTTTPEPSSIALLGTGLIGLVPVLRKRRGSA